MGRKRKPRHLKRDAISISMPLDVLKYLDELCDRTGGSRSRFVESLIRSRMSKGETILGSYIYRCKTCDFEGRSSKSNLTMCKVCYDFTLYCVRMIPLGEEE